jgi:hypothetical protein
MRGFERQRGESSRAYEAFKCYRDLGPNRSIDRAYECYSGRQLGGKRAPGRFQAWSRDFDWFDRAREADQRDDEIRREAIELHQLNLHADQARRIEDLREQNLTNEETAAKLEAEYLKRIGELLETLPLVAETIVERNDDGVPVTYRMQPATKNAVADASKLHAMATRSETPRVDVREYDLSTATTEQLERIAAGEDPAKVLGDDHR